MYNKALIDHFTKPRRLGRLEDANGVGTVGDPSCGDFLRIYIRAEDNVIRDISFLCQGCPAAIASGSATAEMAAGKPLKEAEQISDQMISEYLGGIPGYKLHCSNLGVEALRLAIDDYLGLGQPLNAQPKSLIERLRQEAISLADETGLLSTQVNVNVKLLPPGYAIGENSKKDYPIWKGKEGVIEATFLNGRGQAFTPAPGDFAGKLSDVFEFDMEGSDVDSMRNRGIFIATVNAVCAHLGLAKQTVHCRNEEPELCAGDRLKSLQGSISGPARIGLIGYQPRMAEALATRYDLRIVDLDPDYIGNIVDGVPIEGDEQTDDVLGWCELALVTGSTLANGTIDKYVNIGRSTIFFGMTISGAAALLDLPRFCPRSLSGR